MGWKCNEAGLLLMALIIISVPNGSFLLIILYLGLIVYWLILMVLIGAIDFKFKSKKNNELDEKAIRFNDIKNTEIYLIDIRANRKALLLDKGYIIDIVTDSKEIGLWMHTLRYGSRSERDKDYRALIYKLKEYGLYRGRKPNEQSQ